MPAKAIIGTKPIDDSDSDFVDLNKTDCCGPFVSAAVIIFVKCISCLIL